MPFLTMGVMNPSGRVDLVLTLLADGYLCKCSAYEHESLTY